MDVDNVFEVSMKLNLTWRELHYAVHDCPWLCLYFAASGHKIYVQSVAKLGSL